jgi:amidohydrolase
MISELKIRLLSKEIYPNLKEVREQLHTYPELSFEEYKTSAFIKMKLKHWGIDFIDGIVETGIVAIIEGKKDKGNIVAIRADMDALPIVEANEVEYKSKNIGVMHACGHDVHTTSLLGAIYILHHTRDQWSGTVRCIFQPGEEMVPGGAQQMIKAGALGKPLPKAMIALHVEPNLNVGSFGFKKGLYMASADEIHIDVLGDGGHAANPHLHVDTVSLAAHLLVELQTITSRFAPPTVPTVLSFGKIDGPGATNIFPQKVTIAGTFRTFDETWRKQAHQKIKNIANGLALAYKTEIIVDIRKGYPALKNDKKITEFLYKKAGELYGDENVEKIKTRLSAEDFSFFAKEIPACFYRLGVRNEEKGITFPVHHPQFDADEKAVMYGAESLAYFALELLNK